MATPPALTVHLPPALAQRAGTSTVQVRASTLREALRALDATAPGLYDALCAEDGRLRRHVLVYLNSEESRLLSGGLETRVSARDSVHIVPAVSGGA